LQDFSQSNVVFNNLLFVTVLQEKKLEAFVVEIAKRKVQEETKCIICFEKPRSTVFVGCGT
jgi:hypothetical protein